MAPRIRNAVVGTFLVAAMFMTFTITSKEFSALYHHTPWENDPYDTTVTFAIFFVPMLVGICLLPLIHTKRSESLMPSSLIMLLRGCGVVIAVIILTLLSDWLSVAASANRKQWNGTTGLLIALLITMTVISGRIVLDLYQARKLVSRMDFASVVETDWLGIHWVGLLRRHPVATASLVASLFGLLLAISQVRESGLGAISLLFFAVAWCGMFAFLIVIGSYLGLIRTNTKLSVVERRLLDSVVISCTIVPITLAFRSSLWWIVGSSDALAQLPQLGELLALSALVGFSLTLIFEILFRIHALTGLNSG